MTLLCVSCRFSQVVCPLCATTGAVVQKLQLNNKAVYTPIVAQSLIPMASQTIEIHLLPYTWCRCPCCVGRASSTVTVCEETVALPQLQLLRTSPDVVDISVVAQRQFPMVLRTIGIPQFHFDKVIDVPVVQVERVGRVLCTGSGFTPCHKGGEGVAETPGVLTPRCSATRNCCMRLCGMSRHVIKAHCPHHHHHNHHKYHNYHNHHNNNNITIWGGSVLTGQELTPSSGELKHALPHAGGPTQSQQSRPMSSRHHISMEHRLRRKQLNSDTSASNETFLKEIQEKRKKKKNIKNGEMNKK